jgi:NADH:ubiquinone oxidoreductase subunit E
MAANETCACCEGVSEKEMIKQADGVIKEYRAKAGALIPILQIIQNMFGYLPKPVLKHVSIELGKPYSEVAGVAGFYSFFSFVPRGRHLVRVCLGTACYVRGGKQILETMKKTLGIDVGETTPDRIFSLDIGRCFGACGLAPAVMIDEDVHQRVKPAKIQGILNQYRRKKSGPKRSAKK